MPTIRTDQVASAGTVAVAAERRKLDRRDRIYLLEPNRNPLILLLRRLNKQSCISAKFEYLLDEATPITDRINNSGGYTAGATSLVVDNGSYFFVNCFVQVQRTGEIMHVTAVSTNTLTAVRSWGGTAEAALNDNEQLTILGGGAAEGAAAEDPRAVVAANAVNYTQIFRDGFASTGTLQASSLYGGDYMAYQARARGIEHAKYMELAFWFGESIANVAGSAARRTTGGIKEWITTNSYNFGGALTEEEMEVAAETAFRYGERKVRFLFCGRAAASNVTLLGIGKVRHVATDKMIGLQASQYQTTHGVWNIIPHDLFEGDTNKVGGFSVSLDELAYRFLKGRDTKLRTNIQNNDVDGMENEWLTEAGLERRHERTAMELNNMSL